MYSPKISENLVRQLYQIKLIQKRPMTVIVNEMIKEAVQQYLKEQTDIKEPIKEDHNERMD